MMDVNTVYRPVGRVVVRQIGEDRLLVPVSGVAAGENAIFPVNETGAFIWERLSAGKSIAEIAQELTEVFEVGLDTGQADCEALRDRLLNENLLEVVSG